MMSPQKLMAPYDSFWWQMQHPTFLMYVNYMFTFHEPLGYEELLAVLENRLLTYPRFRQRITTSWQTANHPSWETIPDFELRHYVHRIAVPEPCDRAALIQLLNHLTSRKFDPRRSPWEMYLIEGMETGPVLLGRMHHCIADGIALMNLLNVVADEEQDHSSQTLEWHYATDSNEPTGRLRIPETAQTVQRFGGEVAGGIRHAATHPVAVIKAAGKGVRMGYALARVVVRRPDKGRSYKGGMGAAKVLDWAAPFDLNEIHMVEEAAGVTVNDMLMTVIAGGLRRYWIGRDWPLDKKPLRAIMPFNIRPAEDANELGNGFGVTMPRLYLSVAEPLDRLIKMHNQLVQIKRSYEARAALATMGAIGMTPAPGPALFNRFMRTKATVVITNLPGPTTPRYLAGRAINDIIFWVPAGLWLPIGISIFSYAGEIRVGVVTDEKVIPDPGKLVADIETEWAEMRAAFGVVEKSKVCELQPLS